MSKPSPVTGAVCFIACALIVATPFAAILLVTEALKRWAQF